MIDSIQVHTKAKIESTRIRTPKATEILHYDTQ
jgi:hypothetical protein